MKTRLVSGLVITAFCVVCGLTAGVPLGAVLLFCSLVGYYELARALKVQGYTFAQVNEESLKNGEHLLSENGQKINGLEIADMIWIVAFYVLLMVLSFTQDATMYVRHANMLTVLVLFGVFFTNMVIYVASFPKYHADQVIDATFAFLYAPVMLSCVYRAEYLPYGIWVYALVFLCSWICDTCAYCAGKLFGKHHVAPILSPKKTLEGCIGGVAGSVITCLLEALILHALAPETDFAPAFMVIGFCGSIISMFGDLAASAIKRNHGIKDYGKLIPGHGGIMDRFDSVIFTAPVIYYLGVLFLTVLNTPV